MSYMDNFNGRRKTLTGDEETWSSLIFNRVMRLASQYDFYPPLPFPFCTHIILPSTFPHTHYTSNFSTHTLYSLSLFHTHTHTHTILPFTFPHTHTLYSLQLFHTHTLYPSPLSHTHTIPPSTFRAHTHYTPFNYSTHILYPFAFPKHTQTIHLSTFPHTHKLYPLPLFHTHTYYLLRAINYT